MRTDPMELSLSRPCLSSASRRAREHEGLRLNPAADPHAVDAAFATFTGSLVRVDRGDENRPDRDTHVPRSLDRQEIIRQNQALVASMVAQLEALDRQRGQLASLIEDIDHSASAQF